MEADRGELGHRWRVPGRAVVRSPQDFSGKDVWRQHRRTQSRLAPIECGVDCVFH